MLKKLPLALLLLCICFSGFAALVPVVPDNASTSANSRAPQGSQRYIRTVYIVSPAEMAASGLPLNALVNAIGWSYSAAQSLPTTGTLKVYLENTTDLAYSKTSTAWTNGTTGIIDNMTLVSDDLATIPNAIGNFDVVFTNGAPFVYSGGGLYVAFEYSNASGTISSANTAACNNGLVGGSNGLRNAFSTTAMPTTITGTSNFRPATRLGYPLPNDGTVHDIYSLGKLPMGLATPHVVSARIVNSGDNPLLNLPVTLNITGANTFTDVQFINLATGTSAIVNFAGFTPTNTGSDTLIVTIPTDDILSNNADTFVQDVNSSILAYSNNLPATSSVGFNAGTGILASKYTVNGSTGVLGINAFVFNGANIVGNTLTGIVLDNAGNIIGTSAPHIVAAADLGTYVSFPITVPPVISSQDFYVGILQSPNVTGYFPIGVQPEPLPARPNAYYSFVPAGGAATNYVNLGRVMIDAVMSVFPLAADDLRLFASGVQNDVQLDWTTARETVDHFEIERSADGKEFALLGRASLTSSKVSEKSYRYIDKDALSGSVPAWYYRIKQVETNGDISYSPMASVKLRKDNNFNVTIANPVTEKVQMIVSMPAAAQVTIAIRDVQGKTVYLKNRNLETGINLFSLDDCGRMLPGHYTILVSDGKNSVSQKIIQQ